VTSVRKDIQLHQSAVRMYRATPFTAINQLHVNVCYLMVASYECITTLRFKEGWVQWVMFPVWGRCYEFHSVLYDCWLGHQACKNTATWRKGFFRTCEWVRRATRLPWFTWSPI